MLPISVIIPTRNCREGLEKHLEGMHRFFAEVGEVIGVDGASEDGTDQTLRTFCQSHPSGRFLSLPPGLYEGWNAGIEKATQPWIYFSTVGDILDVEKIEAFQKTAERLDCDVLVSPPIMKGPDGITESETRWPIHRLLSTGWAGGARLLSREETVLGLFSFITGSLLGSSASNLYRTEFLQKHPFPTDFGHAGDTAWGLRNGFNLRMGVSPEPLATFTLSWQFKESDARMQRELFRRLSEEGRQAFRESSKRGEQFDFLEGWFDGLTASKETLWDWLADQGQLAADHHALVASVKEMEAELDRRWPERIYRAGLRLLGKIVPTYEATTRKSRET